MRSDRSVERSEQRVDHTETENRQRDLAVARVGSPL